MGLLDHNNKNNPDKNVNVTAKSVSRADAGFGDNKKSQIPSFDVTMRMNNHTRNAILSLAQVSSDNETANGMIAELVDEYVHKMKDEDFQQYQELFNMLEKKDEISFKLKNK